MYGILHLRKMPLLSYLNIFDLFDCHNQSSEKNNGKIYVYVQFILRPKYKYYFNRYSRIKMFILISMRTTYLLISDLNLLCSSLLDIFFEMFPSIQPTPQIQVYAS